MSFTWLTHLIEAPSRIYSLLLSRLTTDGEITERLAPVNGVLAVVRGLKSVVGR